MHISEFLDDLMPRLPGATEELVLHETFAAMREACEEGWAWSDDFGPLSVTAGSRTIYLNPLPGANRTGYVLQILYTPESGYRRKLRPMTSPPAAVGETSDTPMAFYQSEPGVVHLSPIPGKDAANSLLVGLTVIPTNKDVNFPDYFMTHFRDSIISGVCQRMMLMPSKPWSDGSLAQYHARKWRNYLKRARDITKRKYGVGDMNWRFPDFAANPRRIPW